VRDVEQAGPVEGAEACVVVERLPRHVLTRPTVVAAPPAGRPERA
jgi:hypothetical protein